MVEDDPSIQDVVGILLKGFPYRLIIYSNGDSIMNGDFELPDLFILDKQLPGIDGLDICKHLKSHNYTKKIPVVMVSANPTIKSLAKEAGADDALEKPFKMKSFRDLISRYLDN